MENSLKNSNLKTSKRKDKTDLDISPVTSGGAKIKEKGLGRKIAELFLPQGIDNIPQYIFKEIIVPAGKRQLHDIADMFLGPGSGSSYGGGTRVLGSGVSYNSMYNRSKSSTSGYSQPTNNSFNDILFDNPNTGYDDANAVLVKAQEIIEGYDLLTVNELFSIAGIKGIPHTATQYGWYDINGTRVIHQNDGWHLLLPKAIPINN